MNVSEVAEQYTPLVDWLTEDAVEAFLPAHTPAVLGRYALFSSVHVQTITTSSDPTSRWFIFSATVGHRKHVQP